MNQPCTQAHCAFCGYRHAAGLLTITRTWAYSMEPACWSCARDALAYYARRTGTRASFAATD